MLNDYILVKPILHTDRLILRPLNIEDVPALKRWMPDPEIYLYWGKKPGKTDKNPALLFEKNESAGKSFHLGIIEKYTGTAVGELWIYLIEGNRMAKAAIRIGKPWWNKGYATEAMKAMIEFCFQKTELRRIWTDVDKRNQASVRMLEKCGFQQEGLIREGKMVNTWCDYYLYAVLKNQ